MLISPSLALGLSLRNSTGMNLSICVVVGTFRFFKIQWNLDLVTIYLVTNRDLVTLFWMTNFLLSKIHRFSDILVIS